MTTQQCEYANNGETITQPGKFEGEPVFAPYFWDLALSGCSDRDDGHTYTFRFAFSQKGDLELAEKFPTLRKWLGQKRTLNLSEDSQGFVHCF